MVSRCGCRKEFMGLFPAEGRTQHLNIGAVTWVARDALYDQLGDDDKEAEERREKDTKDEEGLARGPGLLFGRHGGINDAEGRAGEVLVEASRFKLAGERGDKGVVVFDFTLGADEIEVCLGQLTGRWS